jgi:hypothetical protein
MAHALQMTVIVVLFLAAVGAFQLFVVATIVEIVQRRIQRSPGGRAFNWATLAGHRGVLR